MTIEERLTELKAQLAQIRAAIAAILGGAQEYRIGSRSLKRPDLSLLLQEQGRLEREISIIERGGGIFQVGIFEGR